MSEIVNKERATEIHFLHVHKDWQVAVIIAFQAADLTHDAAKMIFSDFQETWPESKNSKRGGFRTRTTALKATIATLKLMSTWVAKNPSKRITHPAYVSSGPWA